MSTIRRSGSSAATALFGTVTTTALSATSAVNALGNIAKVGEVRSNAWRIRTETTIREQLARDIAIQQSEIGLSMLSHLDELEKKFAGSPDRKQKYEEILTRLAEDAASFDL